VSLSVWAVKRLSPGFAIDVSFSVAAGVTIIFGESGSGKTTLLRCVAGLAPLDDGRIVADDRVLFDRRAGVDVVSSSRRVGFVFQHLALFPHLTAADNIAYGLSQRRSALPICSTAGPARFPAASANVSGSRVRS
jgi:molybdate transport system ATP-binding protein